MPTQIVCYGGVGEIGGNKILLEDESLRIFFDFGRSFGRYAQYFDGVFVTERPQRGLLDLLALELIPPLPGLLRDDLIPVLDPSTLHITELPAAARQRKARYRVEPRPGTVKAFWAYWQSRFPSSFRDLRRGRRRPVDAILISHAHLDHIADMAYVSPEVPAYGTRLTAFISKAMNDIGQRGNGVAAIHPRVLSPDGYVLASPASTPPVPRPWHLLDGAVAGGPHGDRQREAAAFAADLKILPRNGLSVRHWPVDHSLFGAVGYAVETQAGWVAYSGDIRFSGRQAGRMPAFAEGLASLKPAALLCEGTRLNGASRITEDDVFGNCLQAVRQAEGRLVIADFAPRNVERLLTFARIAETTGRCLLIQPKDAYLVRAMHLADGELVPDVLATPHVGLYADPKARLHDWETRVRRRYQAVSAFEVRRNPADFILAFSLADLADMLDLDYLTRGQTGGMYIFSNSPAYDDEQHMDLLRLWTWAQRLGFEMVGLRAGRGPRGEAVRVESEPGYHASGHASGRELAEFVKAVSPKTLIPIHTATPHKWAEILKATRIKIVLPKYAQPIRIA